MYALAAALTCITAFAQKQIEFKPQYKPASAYNQVNNTDMHMTFAETGGEPINQDMKMGITYDIKTGKANKNETPFTGKIQVTASVLDNQEVNNTEFYGKVAGSGIVIDSISIAEAGVISEIDEDMKAAFGKMLNQFEGIPAKIKVGESFTTKQLPIDLPVGLGDNANTAVTYTLTKVEGKKAHFDVLLDSPLDINSEGAVMKGTIKVTGTMTYQTDAHYVSGQVLNITGGMNVSKDEKTMTISITGTSNITTKVTPN